MTTIKLAGHVKLPKPKGYVTVQKLRKGPNSSDDPATWDVVQSTEGWNLVMDSVMKTFCAIKAATSIGSNDRHITLGNVFSSMRLTDDGTAVDAAHTGPAPGTVIIGQQNNYTHEDAGLIGGYRYNKYTKESTFYKSSGMVNGYTVRKALMICLANYPNVPLSSPDQVAAKLLDTPIVVEDIEVEAVKVTYIVYFPYLGDPATNNFRRISVGSGAINITEKVLADPETVGSSVNWEMFYWAGRHSTGGTEALVDNPTVIFVDTDYNFVPVQQNTTGVDNLSSLLDADSAETVLTKTELSPTSYRVDMKVKYVTQGGVGQSKSIGGIGCLAGSTNPNTNAAGVPVAVTFDPPISVDWNQSLTIESSITFDWT